jgi:hypothetical protein
VEENEEMEAEENREIGDNRVRGRLRTRRLRLRRTSFEVERTGRG